MRIRTLLALGAAVWGLTCGSQAAADESPFLNIYVSFTETGDSLGVDASFFDVIFPEGMSTSNLISGTLPGSYCSCTSVDFIPDEAGFDQLTIIDPKGDLHYDFALGSFGLGTSSTSLPGGDGSVKLEISSGTPEPSTWALMLAGLGVAGFAMRRRQQHLPSLIKATA